MNERKEPPVGDLEIYYLAAKVARCKRHLEQTKAESKAKRDEWDRAIKSEELALKELHEAESALLNSAGDICN